MAKLHDEFAFFRELKDLIVVAIAPDPHKAFIVHEDAMFGLRPIVASASAAPAADVVPGLIELHNRRTGLDAGFDTARTLKNPDVVLLVAGGAGYLPQRPTVGYFRP